MSDIGLGKNICTKKQLDEFVAFQDSQSIRRVYLAEIAELAYSGRNKHRERGLALGSQVQASIIDIIGMSFFR
jgi:hypothetical protein